MTLAESGTTKVLPRRERARAAKGGVLAGLFAGLVFLIVMLLMNLVTGQSVWVSVKFAALPFLGVEGVMEPRFEVGPVVLGIVSHFAVSAAWGLTFGLLFYDFGRMATVVAGAFWGLFAWLVMHYLVQQLIGGGRVAGMVPKQAAFLEHVLFGISIGLGFLPFQRVRPPGSVSGPTPATR